MRRSLADTVVVKAPLAELPGAIGSVVAALLRIDAPERVVITGLRNEIAALPAPSDVFPELKSLLAGG